MNQFITVHQLLECFQKNFTFILFDFCRSQYVAFSHIKDELLIEIVEHTSASTKNKKNPRSQSLMKMKV